MKKFAEICASAEINDGMVVLSSWIHESNCETLLAVSGWLALAEARNEHDDVE